MNTIVIELAQLDLLRYRIETTGHKDDVFLLPDISMSKWEHCTILHSVQRSFIVFTQEREISIVVNVEALVIRASRVPICFVATLVSLATAARGPLLLASAKMHHSLLAAVPALTATAERHH